MLVPVLVLALARAGSRAVLALVLRLKVFVADVLTRFRFVATIVPKSTISKGKANGNGASPKSLF